MFYNTHDDIEVLERHVLTAVDMLSPHGARFDSIAVRGVSGLIVGSPVALHLRKSLVVVRKPGESAHSSSRVEELGRMGRRVLFFDDFTSTGDTRRAVLDAIGFEDPYADLVGQYLYTNWGEEKLTWFTTSLRVEDHSSAGAEAGSLPF